MNNNDSTNVFEENEFEKSHISSSERRPNLISVRIRDLNAGSKLSRSWETKTIRVVEVGSSVILSNASWAGSLSPLSIKTVRWLSRSGFMPRKSITSRTPSTPFSITRKSEGSQLPSYECLTAENFPTWDGPVTAMTGVLLSVRFWSWVRAAKLPNIIVIWSETRYLFKLQFHFISTLTTRTNKVSNLSGLLKFPGTHRTKENHGSVKVPPRLTVQQYPHLSHLNWTVDDPGGDRLITRMLLQLCPDVTLSEPRRHLAFTTFLTSSAILNPRLF